MAMRIGLGDDIHALCEGTGIPLGGVMLPCNRACRAVSDGDVVLHALTDALLGGLALGDIGERYPEAAVAKGEESRRFVAETMALLRERGARVHNVDCTVYLERPRLGGMKTAIRDNLSRLLGIDAGSVGVKAKTAEGFGAVGRGEAVAARVAVLIEVDE